MRTLIVLLPGAPPSRHRTTTAAPPPPRRGEAVAFARKGTGSAAGCGHFRIALAHRAPAAPLSMVREAHVDAVGIPVLLPSVHVRPGTSVASQASWSRLTINRLPVESPLAPRCAAWQHPTAAGTPAAPALTAG